MMHISHKQSGMSLVELMVAVALSLILTLGVIQIFSSSKQTSRVQNALARLQENARFALDILSRDIRMAGQLGCNQDAEIFDNSDNSLAPGAQNKSGIFGYDYSNSMVVNLTNGNATPDEDDVVEDTDVIVVMAASTNSIPVTGGTDTGQVIVEDPDYLTDPNTNDPIIDEGDPMILSDCETADLFIAGDSIGATLPIGGAGTAFSKTYLPENDAELAELNYAAYYIRVLDGENHLYRTFVNGIGTAAGISSEPLLAGVEDFQILYGELQSDDTIRYVDSDPDDDPTTDDLDWDNVVSVRIHLLMRTAEDNLAVEPQSYWFMGELEEPAAGSTDRHLYRSFTTTIQLRNQGVGT